MVATTPQSRKAKGRKLQQKIRDDIILEFGLSENDVRSTSMGASGCDVLLSDKARGCFPFAIECKAQETTSIPSWWEQTIENANKEDLLPLLIFKQSRKDILVCLKWSDFIKLTHKTVEPNNFMKLF